MMGVSADRIRELAGRAVDPAIKAILDRKVALLEGRSPDRSRRLGLVAEGGAMRATISGGSFIALDFLGLNDVFDHIYASSAGSINGAYFLSGQIQYGVAVYYQLINNRKFVNLWGFVDPTGRAKVVDMDFLFDDIITGERALDVGRVVAGPTSLHASATRADDGKGVLFNSTDPGIDLVMALKAGSAIPVFYNRAVRVGEESFVDGSVGNALPLEDALANGCTDVLVLATRPAGYRKVPSGLFWRSYDGFRLRHYSRAFVEQYFSRHVRYNRAMQLIEELESQRSTANVSVVRPEGIVSQTATRERSLKRVTMEAVGLTLRKFGCEDVDVAEVIQPVLRSSRHIDERLEQHAE